VGCRHVADYKEPQALHKMLLSDLTRVFRQSMARAEGDGWGYFLPPIAHEDDLGGREVYIQHVQDTLQKKREAQLARLEAAGAGEGEGEGEAAAPSHHPRVLAHHTLSQRGSLTIEEARAMLRALRCRLTLRTDWDDRLLSSLFSSYRLNARDAARARCLLTLQTLHPNP
jgi:hypothetical protein